MNIRNIREEIEKDLSRPILEAFDNHGITLDSLVKQLSKELKAKETKFVKVKKGVLGSIEEKIPAGVKKIWETSEEVLLAINAKAWGIQQNARQDAHKLRGDYPAEKLELSAKKPILVFSAGPNPTDNGKVNSGPSQTPSEGKISEPGQ